MFCMMLGILTLPLKLLKEPSTGTFDLFLYIFFDFVEFLYVVSFIYIACQEFSSNKIMYLGHLVQLQQSPCILF